MNLPSKVEVTLKECGEERGIPGVKGLQKLSPSKGGLFQAGVRGQASGRCRCRSLLVTWIRVTLLSGQRVKSEEREFCQK